MNPSGNVQLQITICSDNVVANFFYLLPINDQDDANWKNLLDADDEIHNIKDGQYEQSVIIYVLIGAVGLLWLMLVIHWFCICCCEKKRPTIKPRPYRRVIDDDTI